MPKLPMTLASQLPGGPSPGVPPTLHVVSSHSLAHCLGMSPAAMDRLIKRHGRELRTFGPARPVGGAEEGGSTSTATFLTGDQCDLLCLLSETERGKAARVSLLTTATMALAGLMPTDPRVPQFRTPDEVRRWTAVEARGT